MVKEVRTDKETTAAAENPVTDNAIPVAVPSVEEVAVRSLSAELSEKYNPELIAAFSDYTQMVCREEKELMSEAVSLESWCKARMTAISLCIQGRWYERIVRAQPEVFLVPSWSDTEKLILAMQDGISDRIELLNDIATDPQGFPAQFGMTEQDIMTSEEIGLNEANKRLYLEGTLTIRDLLMTQPLVIVDFI